MCGKCEGVYGAMVAWGTCLTHVPIVAHKDVPCSQVSVDEGLLGQVRHSGGYLATELKTAMWQPWV